MKLPPPLTALALVVTLGGCAQSLAPYADLVVADTASKPMPAPQDGVRVTYLGTNGYLLESRDTTLVVEPYFSRYSLGKITLNAPIPPDTERIAQALDQARFPSKVDGWLMTHAHFDHLLDVPPLIEKFGGVLVASPTGAYLAEAAGVPRRNLAPALPKKTLHLGEAKVTVLTAGHDRVFGWTPYPGRLESPPDHPPTRPKDWVLGTPIAFLIEMGGQRIYVESGGVPEIPPDPGAAPVDLAILGISTRDSQRRYADAVRAVRPRYVLPSHQDDFFLPLEKGFRFLSTSDFPGVLAEHKKSTLPGRLILMDYFRPWTLE